MVYSPTKWRWSSPETPDRANDSCKVKPVWEIQMAKRVIRAEVFWNNTPETIQVKQ